MKKSDKKWILVVDDEPDIINLVRTFIELSFGNSIKFIEAKDGAEATSKLAFQPFDLIITDLRMPRKEGPAFIQSVRESQLNNKAPIFVISGDPDYDLLEEYENLQIFEKPINTDELISHVAKIFHGNIEPEQKISADLFNAVIKSCEDFYSEAAKKSPDRLDPKARNSQEDIDGEIIQVFSLKVGSLTNEFAIGFDETTLAELREHLSLDESVDNQTLCTKVSKNILKFAVKNLSEQESSKVSLVETKVLSKDSPDYKAYKQKYGIVIPMSSPGGHEFAVQALWSRR